LGNDSIGWSDHWSIGTSLRDYSYLDAFGLINIDSVSQIGDGMKDLGIDDNGEMSVGELIGMGR
jgi:hypothetical protein